jgi:hypothetical protein
MKLSLPEEDNTSFHLVTNPVIRKSLKNTNNQQNTKLITNMTKKLENVEYLMKIEKNNKKILEDKYSKQIVRAESQIEKLEKELEKTLKELNEKETKIFEIQKGKLDNFKNEMRKYENVYVEIDNKFNQTGEVLQENSSEEITVYNHSSMIYEDYLSYNHEIFLLRKKIIQLKETLTEIEKTYPKKFEFLLEDIQLEKELNEISAQKKQNVEEIKSLEKNKKDLSAMREFKNSELQKIQDDIRNNQRLIEVHSKDDHLKKLEDHISQNINDLMLFEKSKILIGNFYAQKNFDLENELNVILIKNLNEKLKEMKNEFVSIKNEKILQKVKIEAQLEEMKKTKAIKKNFEIPKFDQELNQKQIELDKIFNEINLLELNCKKKETLFNKYIIVLRNKCKKSAQESYIEMNPALVIETEFEQKFKEEILKNIERDSKFSEEEKIKNKNLVEIYFKEITNREVILQNYFMKKKKNEENLENLLKEIEKIEENLILCENEINSKKSQIGELIQKEKTFFEKIETRNRNLTKNLEQLGEEEFEKYLKANDQLLKNMKKMYGNKVLDKVFKVQKQKFLESVIMDHSHKKGKVNEFISLISKSESILEIYNFNINELEISYKTTSRKYEGILNQIQDKKKEREILDESKKELKDQIETILNSQINEMEVEKRQLQLKFNIAYYIEKINELNKKFMEATEAKENYVKEFDYLSNVISDKERKLHIEDLDLKNNLISLSMGVNEDNPKMTVMPYKVNKSYNESVLSTKREEENLKHEPFINIDMQSNDERDLNENTDGYDCELNDENKNFDAMMKKSLDQINSKGMTSFKDDQVEDIVKSDDEQKSKFN